MREAVEGTYLHVSESCFLHSSILSFVLNVNSSSYSLL